MLNRQLLIPTIGQTGARLNDQFTGERQAGSVDESPSTDGLAIRQVVDTELKLSINDGALVVAGGQAIPAWGDPAIWWTLRAGAGSWARPAGYDVGNQFEFDVVADNDAAMLVGLSSVVDADGAPTDATTKHAVLFNSDGNLDIIVAGATVKADAAAYANGVTYRVKLVAFNIGCLYAISGGSFGTFGVDYTILYTGVVDTTAALYPFVSNYNAAFLLDNVNVLSNVFVDAQEFVAGWPGVAAIWAMNEPLGASVLEAYPDKAFNGTINGPEMGQPSGIAGLGTGGESDGLVDYYGNWSAPLAAAYNPDLNWFISVQSVPAGEWDTAVPRYIKGIGADASNFTLLYKVTANQVRAYNKFGGVLVQVAKTGLTTLNPFFMATQIDKLGTGVSFWANNSLVGTPEAITGTWVGTPTATYTGLGNSRSTSFSGGWKGNIYFAACGNGYDVSGLMIPFATKYGLTEAL